MINIFYTISILLLIINEEKSIQKPLKGNWMYTEKSNSVYNHEVYSFFADSLFIKIQVHTISKEDSLNFYPTLGFSIQGGYVSEIGKEYIAHQKDFYRTIDVVGDTLLICNANYAIKGLKNRLQVDKKSYSLETNISNAFKTHLLKLTKEYKDQIMKEFALEGKE